jgi:NADH-quinone oxidoreductase subunit J
MSEVITFLVAAAVILVGALGVVTAKNPVHSALFLIQTLLGVAVLFIVQDAHFLAAVQIVVYAGAIVILFLFVIMLLGVDRAEDLGVDSVAGQKPLAAIVGAALLAGALTFVLVATDGATGQGPAESPTGELVEQRLDNGLTDIERIGRVLFTDGLVSFQLTALLLTIAVLGAVVLTRSMRRSDMLDDLEPVGTELGSLAPAGANDEHETSGHAGEDEQ